MSNTYKDYHDALLALYSVSSVSNGYKYWVTTLLEKCVGMFEYSGLPDSLPYTEIEKRLILDGYAGIFKHKEKGLVTAYGSIFDMDEYYHPTRFTYAQPKLGGATLEIHKTAVVIYHSTTSKMFPAGLREMIQRYARMLADLESSINILTVNSRSTKTPVAKNQNVAKSYDAYMTQLALGKKVIVNESSIIDGLRSVDSSSNNPKDTIPELLSARESLLRAFLQEIGVHASVEKRERLITEEVKSDEQLLTVNLKDMLNMRHEGIAELNKLFNLNAAVTISPEYQYERTGKKNDNI